MTGPVSLIRVMLSMIVAMMLNGCLGTIVGTAADVTIEVAKVPFKVAGAAVDVANGGEEEQKDRNRN